MGVLERRRRRRRALEMERRLAELDRLDARYGVGVMPARPAPQRRSGGAGGLLLAALLALGVGAWQLGLLPDRLTEAVGGGPVVADSGEGDGPSLQDVLGSIGPWLDAQGDAFQLGPVLGSSADIPTPEEPVSGTGDGYLFLSVQPGTDDPVAYDPCRPVEVVVNPDGAPDDSAQLVATAVARTSEATGLDIRVVGTTSDRTYLHRDAGDPVLVMWATDDEVPELAGTTAGIGGSTSTSDGLGPWRYVTGIVVLDVEAFEQAHDTDLRQAIVDHEFGHLVGLNHVDDPGQLMHATTTGRASYGAGDLAGLAALGEVPCG